MQEVLKDFKEYDFDRFHCIDDRTQFINVSLLFKDIFYDRKKRYKLDNTIDLSKDDKEDYEVISNMVMPNIIYELFVNKKIEVLDCFYQNNDSENENILKFLILVRLINKLNASYEVSNVFTNSDFWGFIESANVFNDMFLIFHMDYFMFNKSSTDHINKNEVFSLTSDNSELYEENKVMEFRFFLEKLFPKLLSIIKSDIFDKHFDSFYSKYAEIKGLTKIELLDYLNDAYPRSTNHNTLLVNKIGSIWKDSN